MLLEFPDDLSARHAETQYMLGDSILVAPVMSADGQVDVYVPEGTWTSLLDGSKVTGPRWVRQRHAMDSLPVLVRPGTVLPLGRDTQRPDYPWARGVTLKVFELSDAVPQAVLIPGFGADPASRFSVRRAGGRLEAEGPKDFSWRLAHGDRVIAAVDGSAVLEL
jgi:alpha-D-xyloside xylohydrolase